MRAHRRRTWSNAARLRCIAVLAAAALAGPACSQGGGDDTIVAAIWATAVTSAEAGDLVTVAAALEPAMGDDIFSRISKQRQYDVAHLYALATQALGDWSPAHGAFVRATGYSRATAEDWVGRLHTAILIADSRDAALSLRHLRESHAKVLWGFDGDTVRGLSQLLRGLPDPADRLAVGQQLETEDWTSPYAFQDASDAWLDHVQALLELGEAEQAVRAARHITSPHAIMAMQVDRRFDPVIAALPPFRDARAAAERNLRRAQDYADLNPRMLAGKLAVARGLIILDRRREALSLLEDTLQSIAASNPRAPLFDDIQLAGLVQGWFSGLLVDLGRTEEAAAARMMAANGGGDSWSAANVARTLLYLGRAKEAWGWIQRAPDDGMVPDQRMLVVMIRACVASANGDQAELAQALDFLRVHEPWMPQARTRALICSNQLDKAEDVLLGQLANPRTRLAALGSLQTTATTPTEPSFMRRLDDGMSALALRPRVKAAIEKVGRRQKFDLVAWDTVS